MWAGQVVLTRATTALLLLRAGDPLGDPRSVPLGVLAVGVLVATCWRGAVAAAPPHEWDDGEWDDGQWGEWDESDDGAWALEAQPAPLLLLTRSSSC